MSMTPLPAGHVGVVVTELAMTQPPRPAPLPASPLRLRPWRDRSLEAYRTLFRRVGARWLWYSRLAMSDAVLAGEIGDLYAVEDEAGIEVGMIELDFRRPAICQVRFLGLVPELAGKGHGRWLLAQTLSLAWRKGIEAVQLFTCSLDHPAALPAYLRAGFTAVGRSFESFPDPRLSGLLPRDCAPQVPLLDSGR